MVGQTEQGPGPTSPISMESGTGARWRALVSFTPLAVESESMPFGWRELLPACIVVISDSGNHIVGALTQGRVHVLTRVLNTQDIKNTHSSIPAAFPF